MIDSSYPHPRNNVKGLIQEVDESGQVLIIKDLATSSLHSIPIPELCKSTWISTRNTLLGKTLGLVCLSPNSEPIPIIEPDWLVDVTEAAQLIRGSEIAENLVLAKRLTQPGTISPALTGWLINTAFDILVANAHLSNNEICSMAEHARPLATAAAVRSGDLIQAREQLESVFDSMRSVLDSWSGKQIVLEPTFLSPLLGLQGRADITVQSGNSLHIIEMKAGKPPTGTSLRDDHASQVSAYAAMAMRSSVNSEIDSTVWYVRDKSHPMRLVANPMSHLSVLLAARNAIVLTDMGLAMRNPAPVRMLLNTVESRSWMSSYDTREQHAISTSMKILPQLDKLVVRAWLTLASLESMLTKLGNGTNHAASDLWRRTQDQKKSAPWAITDLLLDVENSDLEQQHLAFTHSGSLAECSLRIGDPIVLYRQQTNNVLPNADPTAGQILKGALRSISLNHCSVSLRNKHSEIGTEYSGSWTLIADVLDTSVRAIHTASRVFIDCSHHRRNVLLGITSPQHDSPKPCSLPGLTQEQSTIVSRALAAKDLMIIQGPPGTGKTSAVLRGIISELTRIPHERVLAVAFTNRAANEICNVLSAHGIPFLRHGSVEGATSELSIPVIGRNSKAENLCDRVASARCVVATVQSLYSSPEIWEFGAYTTAVVDEASQILEPHLLGIAARVDRTILIGDHHQLPAVVQHSDEQMALRHPELVAIGMTSLARSAFERLIEQCSSRGDTQTTALLTQQGRMHPHIMKVASEAFYGGQLSCIYEETKYKELSPWNKVLPHRGIFVPLESNLQSIKEAELLIRLATLIHAESHSSTIGIITPFRIQNNAIQNALPDELRSKVTVDTIERFQGSERDVILYGTTVSNQQEFESIRSDVQFGSILVDRKLNVALTRAREQFVMVGSPAVLMVSGAYKSVLERLESVSPTLIK